MVNENIYAYMSVTQMSIYFKFSCYVYLFHT